MLADMIVIEDNFKSTDIFSLEQLPKIAAFYKIYCNNVYTSTVDKFESLGEQELTKMAMAISEGSLKEDCENEDDSHWASY